MRICFCLFVILSSLFMGCQSSSSQKTESWSGNMRELANAFEELIPYLYDSKKFKNPIDKTNVESKIKNFSERIHKIDSEKAQNIYGSDPLMLKGLENLQDVASRALTNFKVGRVEYSQKLLQQSARYCFQCHTRMPAGPQHLYWKDFNVEKFNLESYEKAQVYVAMRQFDKAKATLQQFVEKGYEKDGLVLLREQNIKYYMLISVRGQSDFADAQRIVAQELMNKNLSKSFRTSLIGWKKDLARWQKDFTKTESTLENAKKVLGSKTGSSENYKESELIKALVGGLLLHESLAKQTDKNKQSETYFYLGKIYDSFEFGGFWDLSDLYLEMCIETSPHTQQAVSCLHRLKDSIIIKNSGSSSGVALPEADSAFINKLEQKAK